VRSHWIANAIANATFVVIPRAGVLAHIEQPEAFDRALAEFAPCGCVRTHADCVGAAL
jgi:pimeloyl-ACP methyl ester carboxylesterase